MCANSCAQRCSRATSRTAASSVPYLAKARTPWPPPADSYPRLVPLAEHVRKSPPRTSLRCSTNHVAYATQLKKPRSGGGLLLLRRKAPLTRRSVAYFCSGAHTITTRQFAWLLLKAAKNARACLEELCQRSTVFRRRLFLCFSPTRAIRKSKRRRKSQDSKPSRRQYCCGKMATRPHSTPQGPPMFLGTCSIQPTR